MAEAKKKSLYQTILDKGSDAFKGIHQITSRKRDRRAFASAFDNALEARDKAVQRRIELYEKIGKYSDHMEDIMRAKAEERQANLTMEMIKEEYKYVFGESLKETE